MEKENLPNNIAVFPLSDAIFFPQTILPLNIFEDRYIQLVNDCMKQRRMFGMIQPKSRTIKKSEVYQVGCLGKIISLNETNDKRFIISLSGIIRFKIKAELGSEKLYRKFSVDYSDFMHDLDIKKIKEERSLKKNDFLKKIKLFFEKIDYPVNLDKLEELNFEQLINTICMISPFSNVEKQKLIEANQAEDKLKALDEIINFHLFDTQQNKTIQ